MALAPNVLRDLTDRLEERIDSLAPAELDQLPHGAIQLDTTGRVLQINAFEQKALGVKAADVVGRNFFAQVAPCTYVKDFHGRFLLGLAQRRPHTRFRFSFTGRQGDANVAVTLLNNLRTDRGWVLIRPAPSVAR